jgi:hypothetical protein
MTITGFASQPDEFDSAVSQLWGDGWQPMEFVSHPVQTEDGADLMLVRVMCLPG